MGNSFLFGISLTASFLAGVLALFAPCCITFLFPSYLGTIFRSSPQKAVNAQGKVMFYTIIFALGLSFILVPIALGFRFFVFFLDSFHKEIYYLGALILIMMGIATLKPFFRIPLFFHFQSSVNKKINTGSVFGLGLMSGLTSACCAPVLFAAVTLTTLSPTVFQAMVVSLAYVLGIVFPLFVISLFYDKATAKISGDNRQKIYNIFKKLGAGIFILSGVLIGLFNFQNKIQMNQMEGYSTAIRLFVFGVAKNFQNPILDIGTFLIILIIFYRLLKYSKKI